MVMRLLHRPSLYSRLTSDKVAPSPFFPYSFSTHFKRLALLVAILIILSHFIYFFSLFRRHTHKIEMISISFFFPLFSLSFTLEILSSFLLNFGLNSFCGKTNEEQVSLPSFSFPFLDFIPFSPFTLLSMTTSSSPSLTAGPDWRTFTQANGSNNNLAIPSASSPSPARTWGSQLLLGGENVDKRSSIINHNDPIGSRPNSQTGPDVVIQDGLRPIGSQRPSSSVAAGVFAAASSAAARSRANSPANLPAPSCSTDNGIGMMGMGTSYMSHPFRLDNSSSPSFASAHSYQQHDPFMSLSQVQPNRANSGTPKLFVECFPSNSVDTRLEDAKRDPSPQSFLLAQGEGSSNGEAQSPLSPTASASAALASITAKAEGENPVTAYPFPEANHSLPRQASIQRIQPPLRADTGGSAYSNGSGQARISSPAPFLTLPQASSSSLSIHHSGVLSPTAATIGSGGPGASSAAFSPFGSPPRGMPGNDAMEMHAGRNVASGIEQQSHSLLDILDRLSRVESSVKDIHRNISGLSRNVSQLLDRTRNLPVSSVSNTPSQRSTATMGPSYYSQQAQNVANSTQNASEDVRLMGAQLALLTSNVSQLMMQQGGNASNTAGTVPPLQSNIPLTGLGLGNATPQFTNSNFINVPQTNNSFQQGTSNINSRMNYDSPRAGPTGNFGHPGTTQSAMDRNSRLSPRPGGISPAPSNRRWSTMPVETQTPSVQASNGAMNPPDPSVIVTKWEHLNLHPDLLRQILKYGLGPPNKIQQRALPFLFRGSDIIAQAPPTQERIASYVIPVLQLVLNVLRGEPMPSHMGVRGPIAIVISTTVDQATQAQRMALGLGSALGIRVHIAAASSLDVSQEATGLLQTQPQIVVGTPQKMMDLFNYLANKTKGAISLDDIRMVVLDEVDQLIARNLADYVSTLLQILPQPRVIHTNNTISKSPSLSPGLPPLSSDAFSPFEGGFTGQQSTSTVTTTITDRQTAIFSNTVPQDVLNFAQSIHLRESVRVLVRREGGGQGNAGPNGASGPGASLNTVHSNSSALSLGASAGGQNHASGGQPAFPVNSLGASPANNNLSPLSDPVLATLRGLRQYYLYVAVSTSGNSIGGLQSPNPNASQISHAMEMKLDVIIDLLEDIEFGQAVIYTSSMSTQEAVTYKLASKGIEALALNREMASTTRQQVLAKYRSNATTSSGVSYHQAGNKVVGNFHSTPTLGSIKSNSKKALVVYDVEVNPKDVHQVPLIVFYDLPRSVEEYKEKIACAASSGGGGRPSVCVNVVTASGGPRGDIEMLKTLECHLGCKMAELPMNPSQILNF